MLSSYFTSAYQNQPSSKGFLLELWLLVSLFHLSATLFVCFLGSDQLLLISYITEYYCHFLKGFIFKTFFIYNNAYYSNVFEIAISKTVENSYI